MRPRPDGLLDAEAPPELPLMSPRLQGELASDGTLTLSVWGVGEVGRLKVEGLAGPLVVGPNRTFLRYQKYVSGTVYIGLGLATAASGSRHSARR